MKAAILAVGQRDADAVSRRHEFALHHRAARTRSATTCASRRSSATTSASWRGCSTTRSRWADLVVITGGLGPTEDDITRDAVARVLGRAARRRRADRRSHPRAVRAPRHDDAGDQPPAGDGAARARRCCRIRTARRPACGSSTGSTAHRAAARAAARDEADARGGDPRAARAETGGAGLFRRVLKITGRAESDVDAQRAAGLRPVDAPGGADQHDDSRRARPDRAAPDARGRRTAPRRTRRWTRRSRAARRRSARRSTASTAGTLEAVVGDLLRERKLTIAVAESCTGGLLTSRLTDVPGSSDYVERGVVCYSNRAKTELARRARGADRRARRGQRAGGARDGRRHPVARAARTSASASPGSPGRAAARRRSRSARSRSRSPADDECGCGRFSSSAGARW